MLRVLSLAPLWALQLVTGHSAYVFDIRGLRARLSSSPNLRRTYVEGLFQPMHLLVIFVIALLVFGPKELPELGKGIGEGIRGFKSAMKAEEYNPVKTKAIVAGDQS
jgi:sec-independent protein translocase protein TatA